MVMKMHERVGPTQIPLMPAVFQKMSKQATGMPIAKYATPVINAPTFYLPEARIAD